tara:strand:- start:65 stop:271 length:207 start_codon:yes stop_codon:yes gene_type:complete
LVGPELTIADIYLILTQVEMQQCLMDTNIKNSLNNINGIFKKVTELAAFKKRMGIIRSSKMQILPKFE